MTAEILVMNSGAIALAADSAVTVTAGLGGAKIFSSDDKIFALTDKAPVGIMVYGAANFMSIPYETIIKEYRRRYGIRTYAHLRDYADEFLGFLKEEISQHVSQEAQRAFVLRLARGLIDEIHELIEWRIGRLSDSPESEDEDLDEPEEPWSNERRAVVENTIDSYHKNLGRAAPIEGGTNTAIDGAIRTIDEYRETLLADFIQYDLSEESLARLLEIVYSTFAFMTEDLSQMGRGSYAGLIVAGFGEDELLPSCIEYHVEGLFEGVLKNREVSSRRILDSEDSYIRPFAQTDMSDTFLLGINPDLTDQLHDLVGHTLFEYVEELIESLDRYSSQEKAFLSESLGSSVDLAAESFVQTVVNRAIEQHLDEIIDVTSFMPKGQIAEMAEALVNLTSLRRRVSFEEESVGGPTDVAIITKSDGLVWTKRKQYFDPALNREFRERT